MEANDEALVSLGKELQAADYRFTTITPASHHRVGRRIEIDAPVLQRIFGWSCSFRADEAPPRILMLLKEAGSLQSCGHRLRSRVRFSTIQSSLSHQLFVHSAFPTESPDAVFFGPDTYRFARMLRDMLKGHAQLAKGTTLIDVGCGSGAGGIHASALLDIPSDIILCDINPTAIRYSRINAVLNGVTRVRALRSDLFAEINEGADMIIANPPYLVDAERRTYRHGGGALGFDLSLRIVDEGIDRLYPGGRLCLYTGAPVIAGVDQLFETLRPRLEKRRCKYSYEELDPDVFGEELDHPPYDRVDRIAAVALCVEA
jgi:release factor glutamine methyltransferase